MTTMAPTSKRHLQKNGVLLTFIVTDLPHPTSAAILRKKLSNSKKTLII
jgi:hypothetical protein